MKNKDIQTIQQQIGGYEFTNQDLLQQAFVRRSYAKENGGADNELLEFIGDKVLDFFVVRYLIEKYGYMDTSIDKKMQNEFNEFFCDYSEGKLTQIKSQMVDKKSLANRIDELGLAEFLIMGQGDIHNNVIEQDSVKEDLFEAIIGAVAIDSNWNFEALQNTVEIMLNPDSFLDDDENYVNLIYEWEAQKNGAIPLFKYYDNDSIFQMNQLIGTRSGYSCDAKFICELELTNDLPFRGFGKSKSEARKNVCKLAYDWLEENGFLFTIQDEIENPNKDEAINQLETLARRGYFPLPTYEFSQKYDNNGNPIWKAECHIEGKENYYYAVSSKKNDAKKEAAFGMLKDVLGIDSEN